MRGDIEVLALSQPCHGVETAVRISTPLASVVARVCDSPHLSAKSRSLDHPVKGPSIKP